MFVSSKDLLNHRLKKGGGIGDGFFVRLLMLVSEGVAGSMEEAVAVVQSVLSKVSQDSTYILETPRTRSFLTYLEVAFSVFLKINYMIPKSQFRATILSACS